jgi:hypothetical protein
MWDDVLSRDRLNYRFSFADFRAEGIWHGCELAPVSTGHSGIAMEA